MDEGLSRLMANGRVVMLTVGKQQVDTGDVESVLASLRTLIESPTQIQHFRRRLSISFKYDDDPRELWEIPEVCRFVHLLDREFPYWLYFCVTHDAGLYAILRCLMPPGLDPDELDNQFSGYLMGRGFPAMNYIAESAGLGHEDIVNLTQEIADYLESGPLVPSEQA